MKLLIVYGTTEGQTRKIALFMEGVMKQEGHSVTVCDASENPPAPDGFDAILIGASIHISKYQSPVTHYITHHVQQLNKMPGAFFSVCMAVASEHEEEHQAARKITGDYLSHAGWKPALVTQVAGALKYTQYDFFKRLIMKYIAKKEGGSTDTSRDHEYTDWAAVKKFVLEFAKYATGIPAN